MDIAYEMGDEIYKHHKIGPNHPPQKGKLITEN